MADRSLAQDPNELFDIVRADGTPTGRVKARAAVHRDGDWHRAVHVWIAGIEADGVPFLLVQRRGFGKDTWPGRLDATVGGHYRAGEGLAEVLREVEEEVGVAAGREDLLPLGVRISVNESEPGVLDRELQDVFLLRDDRPLTAFRPNPAELAALIRVPLAAWLDLLAGAASSVAAWSLSPGAAAPAGVALTAADLIPTVDRYLYRAAIAASLALRGEAHVAV